jgi:hypothetical protein
MGAFIICFNSGEFLPDAHDWSGEAAETLSDEKEMEPPNETE